MSSVPLDVSQFVLSLVCRFLHGLAPFVVILTAAGMATNSDTAGAIACLSAAAVLCGAGMNVTLATFFHSQTGLRSGCLATALLSAIGLSITWTTATLESLLVASVLTGLGIGSEWSTVSELARRSLPTKARWKGMRIWAVAFPVGVSVAICLVGIRGNISAAVVLTICLSVTVFAGLLLTRPPAVDHLTTQPLIDPTVVEQPASAADRVKTATDDAECDLTDCCGGGIREVRPTSFRHGVLVAVIGFVSLYTTVCCVSTSHGQQSEVGSATSLAGHFSLALVAPSIATLTTLSIGLPFGYLLMTSVAPRVGYTVVLLPFLLLSAVSVTSILLLPYRSGWLVPATFLCGLSCAAVTCGISAVIGELFRDCLTDAQRSRVLCVALFASAAILAGFSMLMMWQQTSRMVSAMWLAIFIVGLCAVRSLPNPMISSLGRNEDLNTNDEELNDVIAALRN